jgi:hypothetical protein
MKKFICSIITTAFVMCCASCVFAADSTVTVELNNEQISFQGQQPVIVNGRTLIPLRGVFEKMGYSVGWEGDTKTAVLTSGSTKVRVSANNSSFSVNGESKALDVPAQIMNGSMMLPLRAIGEAAGASVTWNGSTKTVEIDTKSMSVNDLIKASDYLVAYSKAVSPISEVSPLFDEFNALSGEITATELQSYRVRLYNAGQTVASVKAAVEALDVPDNMTELQAVRIESLDQMTELINLLIDYCDGKVSEQEATDKLNTIAIQNDEIEKRNSAIMSSLSSN